MKKVLFTLVASLVIAQFGYNLYLSSKIRKNADYIKAVNQYLSNKIHQNDECIEAMEHYIKAQIYKKDAQLYLMNAQYNNQKVHKLLADSCKMDCIKYRNKKNK